MKRTKLSDRKLPIYTRGEEIMNMVSHIVGGGFSIIALSMCTIKAALVGSAADIIGSIIYGIAMLCVYTVSSVYHGLVPSTGKKVMQIIDHCAIYLLIAGTYMPIILSAFLPVYPLIAWSLLALEWGLGAVAITLTAIDLKKYNIFSMICYIFMGWAIIFFIPQTISVTTHNGFYLLLSGGISYTIGAILYGVGVKTRWMHSVFHIFVVIGSILQFLAVFLYCL